MSKIAVLSSNGETGIRTSTFYNQTKLNTFPNRIKTRPLLLHSKDPPNQSTGGSTRRNKPAQILKGKKTNKLPMSKMSTCVKRQKCKRKTVSEFKELGNKESNGVTDLPTGKRTLAEMGGEGIGQTNCCKKIRLDLNKNIEEAGEDSTQNQFCAETGVKNKLGGQGEENLSKIEKLNVVDGNDLSTCSKSGQSDTITLEESQTGDKVKDKRIFDRCKESKCDILGDLVDEKLSDNEIFECASSVSQCQSDSTVEKGNNSSGENDEVFRGESENGIFGSPISITQSENSLDENGQNDTESKSSQQTNDNILNEEMKLFDSPSEDDFGFKNDKNKMYRTAKKTENDILVSQSSSCQSIDSFKTNSSEGRKRQVIRKKNGSLDAFVIVEKSRKSTANERLKDSGFHEPFRILGELSSQETVGCSSVESSPLLFSSSSSSTGCSGSLKSKSVSPESQSSITKYFTPLRKSGSSVSLKSSNMSPISDKKGRRNGKGRKITSPSNSPVTNKKEQMFLDLGQKNFGHVTCPTCNMVYTIAQPEDEAYHVKFHHKIVSGLRFKGWKTERVVEHFEDGRVIVILPQDPQSHLKKVATVLTVVDDELGFSSETSLRMNDSKTYLFIADKKVVGCVIAVLIQEAFPLLPCSTQGDKFEVTEQGAWCCSTAPVRAQCGISRVWVLQQYRRKKIATRILDCVRNDFMFGGVVAKELLAFSDPTPLGKQLAESYCGIENFLVFR
ncbi:N-acetyltransferase ESCO2-like [Dendronephthya gigantea]|uniref:N-acetyltransferase ESCO2-like n=1 Tax=Dendronephthya gigantea TaxID=151771 RepID=UPI00106C0F11|nr:N-acetyltransferase ESCO2-like [Dendronephthya gigantea]